MTSVGSCRVARSVGAAALGIGLALVSQADFAAAEEKASRPVAASAGSGPAAGRLVSRAIEAEVQANSSRRAELLDQALVESPDFAPARWQSGQVRYGTDWLTPEAAAARAAKDELLAEYRELRSRYGDSKDAQLVLARWCQKHGLTDELRGARHAVAGPVAWRSGGDQADGPYLARRDAADSGRTGRA